MDTRISISNTCPGDVDAIVLRSHFRNYCFTTVIFHISHLHFSFPYNCVFLLQVIKPFCTTLNIFILLILKFSFHFTEI